MMTIIQLLKPQFQQIKKSKKGRKAKPKPVVVNRRIELYYTRQLLAIAQFCQDQTKEIVLPTIGENIGDGWFSDMFNKVREKLVKYVVEVAKPLATKVVVDSQKEVDKQIAEHTKSQIGIDLTPFYQASDIQSTVEMNIATNVALIKSIPQQYFDKLEALVMNALQTGLTNEELAQEIHKLGQSTEYRARLIAADQMGKINADINEKRQRSLGVESYDYLTSKDEKVRPLCRSHHGKTFKWDSPPAGGHPGKKVRCRCTAVPNYEDILID
ncbi:minor capsid protein [Acinetobacter sp. ANC 3832]|uniref:phage head morphogenesis protein n=1 Tax=Acinetobacter sp. ANC 3832 TaxID=1977874 RepID=UPI000A357AE9|nr:minor capsid protein [Acinetobacter sp. ANC 3832]OTG95001.1 phage head morphogenesis protein [Acinetobacter sp. ANC 3832]